MDINVKEEVSSDVDSGESSEPDLGNSTPETTSRAYPDIDALIATLPDGRFCCVFCQTPCAGKRKSNAIRHCKTYHLQQYQELEEEATRKKKLQFRTKCVFNDKDDYVKNALKFTIRTLNTFSIWDEPEMRRMTNHFDHLFGELTGKQVEEMIPIRSEKLREKVSKILSGEFFSLKLSIGLLKDTFVLAISASRIINCRVREVVLDVMRISRAFPWNYKGIQDIVLNVLHNYNLSSRELIAITTVVEGVIGGGSFDDQDLKDLEKLKKATAEAFPSKHIPCVSNALNSIIENFLDSQRDLIEFLNDDVQKLRKTWLFKSQEFLLPSECNYSSWSSVYEMFLELTSNSHWAKRRSSKLKMKRIDDLVNVLKQVKELLEKMATESYLVGDFIRDLSVLEVTLQMMATEGNTPAEILLLELGVEKKKMTSSPSFMAAIYLDPRYNRFSEEDQRQSYMSEIDRAVALEYLETIHKQITEIRNPERERPPAKIFGTVSLSQSSNSNVAQTVEKMLGWWSAEGDNETITEELSIKSKLRQFYTLNCGVVFPTDPLQHLQYLDNKNTEVKELALLIQATTSFQVSLKKCLGACAGNVQRDIWVLQGNADLM